MQRIPSSRKFANRPLRRNGQRFRHRQRIRIEALFCPATGIGKERRIGQRKNSMAVVEKDQIGFLPPSQTHHNVRRLVPVHVARNDAEAPRGSEEWNGLATACAVPYFNYVVRKRGTVRIRMNADEIGAEITIKVGNGKGQSEGRNGLTFRPENPTAA